MSETATRNASQELVARVRDPLTVEQLKMALPPTVTVDRFVRVMTSAILANPDIANLEHTSVLRAMVQSAGMGLIPDGKQAAITSRKGKAVLVPMIQGFRDIAAEHGWTLRTAVVYANDEFDHVVIDGEESIIHRPVRPGADRGGLIAAYAIAKHRDGRKLMNVLHPDDIAKRRESSAYDAVWNSHPAAMWEKSAGRDLFGQLGLAESDAERSRIAQLLKADMIEDPAAALYGPRPTELPASTPPAAPEAGSTTPESPPTADAGLTEQPASEPDGQQAGVAPDPQQGDATPVPGPAEAEPVVEQDAGDDIQQAAEAASTFVIPNGQNKGKTLAEIHSSGEKGVGWIKWALKNIGWPAPETERDEQYRAAVWAFARVFAPDLYQQVAAEKGLVV